MATVQQATVLFAFVNGVRAQFDFGNGNGNGNGNGGGNFQGSGDFDYDYAMRIRKIHGVFGALAFVVLFPLGSVLMRMLPGRLALWAHAVAQTLSYGVYIASAGMGIWLVRTMQIPFQDGTQLTNSSVNYHPIIGLVVLAALFFQPALGLVHHAKFKRVQGRQIWSYLHLYNGRFFITLGIVNGGLGLKIADESKRLKTAYGVVAGILWAVWMLVALSSKIKRARTTWRMVSAGGENSAGHGDITFP